MVVSSPTGTRLPVLQAGDARGVEDLLNAEEAGRLLTPAVVAGTEQASTAKVVSEVFAVEEPPALVLVTAGGWLLLAERGNWPEGRWLAVDLATALERRDARAGGELETIAALVSADSLTPADDGTTPLLTWLDDSVKHAVGVSKDLRDGVRESIELLASEVLRRRRTRGLLSNINGLAAELTRQSLRYLYRILFLLYAEARPELGVLPVGAPEYAEGYGLDRLRDLALTALTSDAARNRTHLYESLGAPVRLVDTAIRRRRSVPDGRRGATRGRRGEFLGFEALRAGPVLSSRDRADRRCRPRDGCLQAVLGRLLLYQEQRGSAADSSPRPTRHQPARRRVRGPNVVHRLDRRRPHDRDREGRRPGQAAVDGAESSHLKTSTRCGSSPPRPRHRGARAGAPTRPATSSPRLIRPRPPTQRLVYTPEV